MFFQFRQTIWTNKFYPLRNSTPHSPIVLRQHTDTIWSCPTYPRQPPSSQLLSCHIYLMSCSYLFPTQLRSSCLLTFVSPNFFPGWDFWANHFVKLFRLDCQAMLKPKLSGMMDSAELIFKVFMFISVGDDNNETDILCPLTCNYDPVSSVLSWAVNSTPWS